jgi:cobalamin synthase
VLAAVWFLIAALGRRKDRGLGKLALIAGIWALAMAAWAAFHAVEKTFISAVVVIPLLVSTIVQFGMIIAAVSRITKGKFSQRAFMAGTLTIIGLILLGVVLMFQPFTPTVFNLGFDFVLIALLAFNIWSHVTPRAKVVEVE